MKPKATDFVLMGSAVALRALAGLVGAFLVWNLIYGIGARVVTDETYARLEQTVAWSGCGAGLLVGLVTIAVRRRPAFGALATGHSFATMAGFVGGSCSWVAGLWGYFGALAAFVVLMIWRGIFDYERAGIC